MSELRWHPLLREWVAVAAVRQDRPQMPKDWCPFDPGSGRVPAAFNNLIGLKPTRGLLSARGVVPACRSLDCISIFALTAGAIAP